MDETLAIELVDVGVNYLARTESSRWKRKEITVSALAGIDMQLHEGDSLGLVGHNGSGKSTLLQVIAGLIPPSTGSVLVSSQPQLLGVRAALGPMISGRRNIELCCLALGFRPAEVADVAEKIAEFTELGDFLDLPVATYSSGMAQRLSFAISASTRPKILLVDEALAVGDYQFKQKCLGRLREISDASGVVIMASHAMSEIQDICTQVLWLHEGKAEMFGDPETVIAAYEDNQKKINRSLH